MKIRSYSDLITFSTFIDRYEYLKLNGAVGESTFGFDRYLNQIFYNSTEWKRLKSEIIIRDGGCDLGIQDNEIFDRIIIHHMNPLSLDDIVNRTEFLMNPEYLICTKLSTHNAIHYGNDDFIKNTYIDRQPNDTCPWRK